MRQKLEFLAMSLVSAVLAIAIYAAVRPAEAAFTPVPKNAILYFNQTTCPSGWTVVSGARGRYIVGLNVGGGLASTNGTALTNLEDRAAGVHNHTASSTAPTINDSGHTHTLQARATGGTNQGVTRIDGLMTGSGPIFTVFWDGTNQGAMTTNTTGITTNAPTITVNNSTGTANTNAPYVQYLVCMKN